MAEAEEMAKKPPFHPNWKQKVKDAVGKHQLKLGGRKTPPARPGLQLAPPASRTEQVHEIVQKTRMGVGDIARSDVPAEMSNVALRDLPPAVQERHRRREYTKEARKRGAEPYAGKYGAQILARDQGLAQGGDFDAATRVAASNEADARDAKRRRTFSEEERAAVKAQYQPASESPERPTLRLRGTRPQERGL